MNKKGQITIFIIVGIVILVLIGAIFFIRQAVVRKEVEVPVEAKPLQLYVEKCLETTAVNGIQLAGVQGGYVDIPALVLETDYSTIAYHYYNGNITIPALATIESQISSFVEDAFVSCLDNFSSFKEQGYGVETGDIEAETVIRADDVYVRIDYPVTLIEAEEKIELGAYSATVPIRLGYVIQVAEAVTAKTASEPEWVDMTFLSEFDVDIDIIPNDESSFVYSISDSASLIDGEPYVFLFANSFIVNQPPVLTIEDILRFKDGEPAILKIEASDPEGDILIFSDDTAMFDITEDGVILFTPEVPGEYDVTITVTDDHRNEVSKVVKFVIE